MPDGTYADDGMGVALRPHSEQPRGTQQATAIQAARRGTSARQVAAEQRRVAREAGLETWTTLESRSVGATMLGGAGGYDMDERGLPRHYDEFQETLQEAQARRALRQKQHNASLNKRALQRERDGVNNVVCRQGASTSQGAAGSGGVPYELRPPPPMGASMAAVEAASRFYDEEYDGDDGYYEGGSGGGVPVRALSSARAAALPQLARRVV